MVERANQSRSGKGTAFNRAYLIVIFVLLALVLGAYLFFASTRQSHSTESGSGTQKGMVTLSRSTRAV